MAHAVSCPRCKVKYKYDRTDAGESLDCACGNRFTLPTPPGRRRWPAVLAALGAVSIIAVVWPFAQATPPAPGAQLTAPAATPAPTTPPPAPTADTPVASAPPAVPEIASVDSGGDVIAAASEPAPPAATRPARAAAAQTARPASDTISSAPKTVQVRGYTRRDGTVVQPYTRSAPRARSR